MTDGAHPAAARQDGQRHIQLSVQVASTGSLFGGICAMLRKPKVAQEVLCSASH